MKRLLALDQATAVTGYSLWEDGTLVKWGKQKFEGETIERIAAVREWLEKMIAALTADGSELEIVLEDIQLQQDVVTFKTLAWLQGTLLVDLYGKQVKTRVFFSTEWKKTCGVKGAGRTEQKRNAQKYVADTFNIKATQDECDAICLGKHALAEDDKVVNW
jgi:Holliday junction resolvasome RuvABC endonuclease subunit